MAAVAARDGYQAASVARVSAAAGVSRATFYQHFTSREDCFSAVYRRGAEAIRGRMALAACAVEPRQRPRVLLELLLAGAAARPDCARVILVEALAGPAAVRAEHERLLGESAAWIAVQQAAEGPGAIQAPPAALLGAVIGTASRRLLSGRGAELPSLAAPLLAWFDALRCPTDSTPIDLAGWRALGHRLSSPPPGLSPLPSPLPRGSTALPSGQARAALRDRILRATADLIAARGYAAVTVSEIVATARVSRRAFYACFDGKRAAFHEAQNLALRESIAAAAADYSLAPSWPEGVWRACDASIAYMARHPALTRLGLGEIYAAGAQALRNQEEGRNAYALFLERGYAEFGVPPACREICSELTAAAVFSILRAGLQAGGAELMRSLLPQVAYVVLAPFVGAEWALSFVRERVRAAQPEAPEAPQPAYAPLGRA